MRKRFVAFCVSFVFVSMIIAQPAQLIIKGYGKDIHLDHTVSTKEGIFSIGRLYNVHPKTIAAYNNLDMTKGLSLGQVIHIPLTDTNFSQRSNKGTPIYYKVGEKETLEKVSNVNNRVSLQHLRDWNKLPNDNLTAGKKLIIGYLVSTGNPVATITPVEKKEEPKKEVIEKQVVNTDAGQDKPAVKDGSTELTNKKTEPVATKPTVTVDMSGQGYFKSYFDQQVKAKPISKTETVTSGIFKMLSEMQEAKYYLLLDGVPSGTIVRVINPENNKAIYAKVLGKMNGIRQNQGFDIRISNAAASTLGITETDKFIIKINY